MSDPHVSDVIDLVSEAGSPGGEDQSGKGRGAIYERDWQRLILAPCGCSPLHKHSHVRLGFTKEFKNLRPLDHM